MNALYIYNLFPRLCGTMDRWTTLVPGVAAMGFNCIYLNPFHACGASRSLYAVMDYYSYGAEFCQGNKSPEAQLRTFLDACAAHGIEVFADLVVNHTAIDSPLTQAHLDWYVRSSDGSIQSPSNYSIDLGWVTWRDLGKLDLLGSPNREALWAYLLDVGRHYLRLGFKGFRCDLAKQVPTVFWKYLISTLRKEFGHVVFLAESFVCSDTDIDAFASSGFDYIFNSSKWWNFDDEWCLQQYRFSRHLIPSISFPESHDTPRLLSEVSGNEHAFLQRLYFSALFSRGFMIPSGFEYGFTKRIDCLLTEAGDWEKTGRDYRGRIRTILAVKSTLPVLNHESELRLVAQPNSRVLCFTKHWETDVCLILVNKDVVGTQRAYLPDLNHLLASDRVSDWSPEDRASSCLHHLDITLAPGEVRIFAPQPEPYQEAARGADSRAVQR